MRDCADCTGAFKGRELHQKYGHYYFDFAFAEGKVSIEGHNIVASLIKAGASLPQEATEV